MKKIKIIADSTCDLSNELIDKYDVEIIPLQVNLDDKTYFDKVDIQPDELYAWSVSTGGVPKTSAASPEMVKNCFEKYADCDIIAFTIGAEMSSTYQIMCTMAQEVEGANIEVIDSANLSTGIGLQVLLAARLIEQGVAFDKGVSSVRDIRDKVRAGFIVEDVNWLHKGGRCSALAAFGATALKLRPTLAVVDGKIKVDKKVRGDIASATLKYAKGLEEGLLNAQDDVAFITHSGVSEEIIASVKAYVESLNIFKEIHITRAGCVISSHCGKGTLGVLFISK